MKKVTTSLLLSTMILVPMTGVLAANDETGANTKASVTLKKANTTNPIDPVEPGEDPDDKGTGNTGSLRIDAAPSFVFGEMELGKGVVTTENTRLNSSLQISDLQEKRNGWKVTAKASSLTNEDDSVLSGAIVTLVAGDYVNYIGTTPEKIELEGMKKLKEESINISNEAAPVFVANSKEGGGTWVERFAGEKAKLMFNSNKSDAGNYTGTITWEISTDVVSSAE